MDNAVSDQEQPRQRQAPLKGSQESPEEGNTLAPAALVAVVFPHPRLLPARWVFGGGRGHARGARSRKHDGLNHTPNRNKPATLLYAAQRAWEPCVVVELQCRVGCTAVKGSHEHSACHQNSTHQASIVSPASLFKRLPTPSKSTPTEKEAVVAIEAPRKQRLRPRQTRDAFLFTACRSKQSLP